MLTSGSWLLRGIRYPTPANTSEPRLLHGWVAPLDVPSGGVAVAKRGGQSKPGNEERVPEKAARATERTQRWANSAPRPAPSSSSVAAEAARRAQRAAQGAPPRYGQDGHCIVESNRYQL